MIVLRFFPFLFVAVALTVSWTAGQIGEPPLTALFSPRAEAVVIFSGLEDEASLIDAGTYRRPMVRIDVIGPENPKGAALRGLPRFPGQRMPDWAQIDRLNEIAPQGARFDVRLHDGAVYVDRIDWFPALIAVLAALLALPAAFFCFAILFEGVPGRR